MRRQGFLPCRVSRLSRWRHLSAITTKSFILLYQIKMEDSMELYATVVYVVSSELLKILGVQDDTQAKMQK